MNENGQLVGGSVSNKQRKKSHMAVLKNVIDYSVIL